MLYHLFHYLQDTHIPGARLFEYITFRSGFAFILSLFIGIVIGRRIIFKLKNRQMCDKERDEKLGGNSAKQGTPTMGGTSSSSRFWCLACCWANSTTSTCC